MEDISSSIAVPLMLGNLIYDKSVLANRIEIGGVELKSSKASPLVSIGTVIENFACASPRIHASPRKMLLEPDIQEKRSENSNALCSQHRVDDLVEKNRELGRILEEEFPICADVAKNGGDGLSTDDVAKAVDLSCVPLWGFTSVCGRRAEMEDAAVALPRFLRVPTRMLTDGQDLSGVNQDFTYVSPHFFGVYDGHGGSQPNREDERERIEAAGGKVIQWDGYRVSGVLAMSRSIGDRYLEPYVIPDPEITFVSRTKEDECLILASDGLWDVVKNDEACDIARKRILLWHKRNGDAVQERGRGVDPAAQDAADYLTRLALLKGSRDNISVIVVDLKAQRKFKKKP